MLKQRIKDYVNSHRDEIVSTLMELVKIPSVSTDRISCDKMQLAVRSLYENYGFSVTEGEEYILAHFGDGKEEIGLFAHSDVVDGGEGWLLTTPFEPIIHEGVIVGRGAWDDKSAVVHSFYALRALKELNIPITKKVVAFIGFNEENGMSDIKNYIKSHTPPDFSLVMDAGFPAYYGDKGKAWVRATSRKRLSKITELHGGKMINITLGCAVAKVRDVCDFSAKNDRVMAEKYGNDLILKAEGVSTHGATPEGAINGAYLIAEELKDCDFLDNCDRELMSTLAELLKSPYGEAVGIENDDDEFGRLTMTNGMIDIVDSRVSLTFDLRFGKEIKVDKMLKVLEASLDKMGFDLEIISADNAYAIDTENEYFKRYIEAYKSYTGEENINLRINAGSTYAKCIGKACEVGTRYKGTRLSLPNGHGNAHQPDENISIDGLLNAMEIIIYSVAELCK